jgi:hypothetical protein
MNTELAAAVLLVVVPVAFNVAFAILGATFDYPGILRRSPEEILRRFDAGGSHLRLQWWAFMVTALGMLPLAVVLSAVVAPEAPALAAVAAAVGAVASLVQTLGLARWPFLVPELARRYVAASEGPDGTATRTAVEVVFVAAHRMLGVGVGEHLGYLLTGAWTLLIAAGLVAGGGALVPLWLALLGVPIGVALVVGAFEFVGPHEPQGWWVADRIVPVTYIAWSLWLVALGTVIGIAVLA